MQSERKLGYKKQNHGRLIRSTDPPKTAAALNMLELLVRTRVSKKVRDMTEMDSCRLCG